MPSRRLVVTASSLLFTTLVLCQHADAKAPLALSLRLEAPASKAKAEGPLFATLALKNISKQPVTIYSHVATHETHYDWFRVKLRYPGPSREGCSRRFVGRRSRWVRFVDARDKSAPVTKRLAPGQTLSHRLDLRAWARRKVNGRFALGGGFYKLQAEYHVGKAEAQSAKVWGGTLRSKPLRLEVVGKWQRGVCKKNPGWDRF